MDLVGHGCAFSVDEVLDGTWVAGDMDAVVACLKLWLGIDDVRGCSGIVSVSSGIIAGCSGKSMQSLFKRGCPGKRVSESQQLPNRANFESLQFVKLAVSDSPLISDLRWFPMSQFLIRACF